MPEATINQKGLISREDKLKLSIIPQDSFSLNYYPTPFFSVGGLKINTHITLDQHAALKLEIDYGFCQNKLSNERISLNIRYWDYSFIGSCINKIGSERDICSIVTFLEYDRLCFFINFNGSLNVAGGLIGLRVMGAGSAFAITDQVQSLEWSKTNYIQDTNTKEFITSV